MKERICYYGLKKSLVLTLMVWLCQSYYSLAQETDRTESPYFSVVTTDTAGVEFPLLATNVKATISGVIANVEIEQVYQNSGDSIIDATYIFPMSTNAAVYSMQMILDERVIDAEIKEKAEAQQIFDDANEAGQTATLLDQQRPNVFQMSLANIQPGNVLQVKMKYTELVEPEKGFYQFVVPSSVGPRFTNGTEEWVFQSIKDSLAVANTAFNIDLTINAGMEVTAECTSHITNFVNNGTTASCYLETSPGKDFIVDYNLEGNQIETGMLLYEGEEENFFLTMIQPPKSDIAYESPPREYVFIMDVSGSMRGEPIEVSKQMISNLLSGLNQDDRFNILFFAGGSAVFSPNSLPVTPQNITNAIAFIDGIEAGGSTQLLPAMQQALSMQGTADFSRTFVILTDGYVTVEKEAFELIRQNLNNANFFAFGIGTGVNRYIIEGIAYVGEGESFVVTDVMNAQSTADTFKEYIERPALTNIHTEFSGVNVYDVEPLSIPDVFAERPVIIYGKYDRAENGTLTLSGDHADSRVVKTLNFPDYTANADENIAIKYLWARKKIQLIADYGIASDESDTLSIEEEITQLGLQYNLVTEYTSFVAVDTAAVAGIDETNTNSYTSDDFSFGPVGPPGVPGVPGADAAPPPPPSPAPPAPPAMQTVFTNYPWLSTYVNPNNCAGESITVYNAGSYNFVLIQNGIDSKLYFENGTFYCNETPTYSCVAAYSLSNIAQTWTCSSSPAPTLGCTDATANNYNAQATVDDGSCTYSAAPDCSNYTGTFFYQDCGGLTYYFIRLADGRIFDPYFADGIGFTPYEGQVVSFDYVPNIAVTTPCSVSEAPITITCAEEVRGNIFEVYAWLNEIVNPNNCNGEVVKVYDFGSYDFITIESAAGTDLYYQNGTYYCSSSFCLDSYGIADAADSWTCGDAVASVRGCTNVNALNYNPAANEDDGSCIAAGNCANYTGTFFFQDCGGTEYYFIRLDNGRIFDPYFAEGINFVPTEGQVVQFDYVANTEVTTPCSVSEAPITITCVNPVRDFVFDTYPWLSTLVNVNNCNEEKVTVYDAGSYEFLTVETASGTDLYYQNGTFYCSDAVGFSCAAAYGLSNIANSWSCGELPAEVRGCTDPTASNYNSAAITDDGSCTFSPTFEFDFTDYPWLNALVNPINCAEQVTVSEFDFGNYAFLYVSTINGGSLYIDNGTFYCEDADGQTCLSRYNLSNPTSNWACSGFTFYKFDYIYTICAGESVTLTADYNTNSRPCSCPPNCAPVGPPAPPTVIWSDGSCSIAERCSVSPTVTSSYQSNATAIDVSGSICFIGGPAPQGPAGPNRITDFLVVVEQCPPNKTLSSGHHQKEALPSFNIYPNPATDKVFIDLSDQSIDEIKLMDISGKVVKQIVKDADQAIVELDVSTFSKGIYLIEAKNASEQSIQKLIIE